VANLIATPRQWKNKAILVKPEASYGEDATPTGEANWIEARNVTLTPMDVERADRNIELPYMGSSGSVVVSKWAKLSFDVAYAGSGTVGTAPKWGALMLGCGMAETTVADTSVAYNLVSTAFGSVCAYINIDGVLHKLTGGRGDVRCKLTAKGTPMLSFSYDFLYLSPIAGGLPTVTRTGWTIEEGVTSINTLPATLNGVDLAFSDLEWSLGNSISRVDIPGPHREVAIVDRAPQASLMVLAPPIGTFDPFALCEANQVVDLTTTHGTTAGKQLKTDLKVRVANVEYDRIEEMLAYKLTLEPAPVDGNDEVAVANL